MNPHRSYRRIVLISALVFAASGSTARFVHADWEIGLDRDRTAAYLHRQLFGNYGLHDMVFGTPAPTYTGWPPRRVTPTRVARRVAPPRTARFDNLNLSVNMPGGPWVKLDPKKTGSRACLLMSRRNPTIVISLAAERVGIEANDTNSSLLAVSQAKMKSLPDGVVLPGERQLTANGIQGVSYDASAAVENGTTVHYSIWIAAHNGYNYSLAVFGEQKYKSAIEESMRSFLRGIKQIEPNKVARTDTKSRRG